MHEYETSIYINTRNMCKFHASLEEGQGHKSSHEATTYIYI